MTKPKPHKEGGKQFNAMCVILVRLESYSTDIVITVNIPHGPNDFDPNVVDALEDPNSMLIEDGQSMAARIAESFDIKSWDLFRT